MKNINADELLMNCPETFPSPSHGRRGQVDVLGRVKRRVKAVRGDRPRGPRRSVDPPDSVDGGGAAAAVVHAVHGVECAVFEHVGVVVRLPSKETPHETVVEVVPHPGV